MLTKRYHSTFENFYHLNFDNRMRIFAKAREDKVKTHAFIYKYNLLSIADDFCVKEQDTIAKKQ